MQQYLRKVISLKKNYSSPQLPYYPITPISPWNKKAPYNRGAYLQMNIGRDGEI